jgi:group I intron endonuclease
MIIPDCIKYKSRGVYVIFNTGCGKCYIGSSVNLRDRLMSHSRELSKGKHENIYLQRAYNKYGKDAFMVRILEYVGGDKDTLLNREQFWIDTILSYNGYIMPEETKKKISETNTGKKRSLKSRQKMSESKLGKDNYGVAKKCKNIDTGKVFSRVKDAAKHYNISYGNLCQACKGKRKKAGGYRWRYI